jgi:RNA polymerase sigma-70 factor, ECF subfamily
VADFPDKDWCSRTHSRLVSEDVTAPAELYKAIFAPLVAFLFSKGRTRDRELVLDAATDAVTAYLKRPHLWDASKASLVSYLCMAADRDLLNLLEKAKRRERFEVLAGDVEDGTDDRNVIEEEGGTRDALNAALSALRGKLKSDQDVDLVTLMLAGERSTDKFAAVLGIKGESREQQARIVKQHKDRLKKVLQRLKDSTR